MIGLREHDEGGEGVPGGTTDVDIDERRQADKDPVRIVCDACGHELTTAKARTSVDGAHRHVKVNPHGHVFHIACFQPVPGVMPMGPPSEEFSWFAGCRWQIALCGGCTTHVGWTFSGDAAFGALIEGRFREEG